MSLLVVDVEATCWPDDQPTLRDRQRAISEIIEIGAVRLVGDALEHGGEYQAFVRPLNHPELSDFCTQLTSITQAQVRVAPPFAQAWSDFLDWFRDDLPDVVMGSWSSYDHALFSRQCAEHGLEPPPWHHIDIKAEFGAWNFLREGRRGRARLSVALERLGIEQDGRAHRAIDDARNTADLLRHLRAPQNLSPLSHHVLRRLAELNGGSNATQLRDVLPSPGRWYHRVRKELVRAGVCREMPQGRGLELTEHGHHAVRVLDLDSLPEPTEPAPPKRAS